MMILDNAWPYVSWKWTASWLAGIDRRICDNKRWVLPIVVVCVCTVCEVV